MACLFIGDALCPHAAFYFPDISDYVVLFCSSTLCLSANSHVFVFLVFFKFDLPSVLSLSHLLFFAFHRPCFQTIILICTCLYKLQDFKVSCSQSVVFMLCLILTEKLNNNIKNIKLAYILIVSKFMLLNGFFPGLAVTPRGV